MLKKNKGKLLLSCLILLLPMLGGVLLWDKLPDLLPTHFGAGGTADGYSGKAFAVFGLPCILLALHGICLLLTLTDKKQQGQNQKALGIVFWLLPTLSVFINVRMYRAAFGKPFDGVLLVPALFGLLFLFMGNYLPKVKQNQTLGIKVWWALHNEENWNATHRFGGKVWVVSGVALLLCLLLPLHAVPWVTALVLTGAVLSPMVYSYCLYRQHQKQGIAYAAAPERRGKAGLSAVFTAVIVIGAALLMFTGNVEATCGDTALAVNATYWADVTLAYADMDAVSYCRDLDVGVRTNGLGSARLSLGSFQNERFGAYTLYAYADAKEFVVLRAGEKTLVIGLRDTKDTQALYAALSEKLSA